MCASFHLKVSLDTALSRTGSGAGRPMLAGGEEAARALYSERLPVYRGLGTEVDADCLAPGAIAAEIVRLLKNPREKESPVDSDG